MPRPIGPAEPPTFNPVSGNLPVPAKLRRRRLPVLTWIGLSVVVLVAAAVVVQGRDAIVAQWPYAERLTVPPDSPIKLHAWTSRDRIPPPAGAVRTLQQTSELEPA